MISADKVSNGITRYLDAEILPKMPTFKAVAFGTIAALYLRRLPELIPQIPQSMGITNGADMVDIDTIKDALYERVKDQVPIDVPMIGRITFDRSEVDKMYRYIMEA